LPEPSRPLVVVSNDDGIDSPYLEPLASGLERLLGVETLVVAPERERSAVSHAITLHKPLRVRKRAAGRYTVSGSPVDCVYLAVRALASRAPSLVVSGINNGYNLGNDVHYSGTVGAAVEGSLKGVPSIAASLAPDAGDKDLETAVEFVCGLADSRLKDPSRAEIVTNVNVPRSASKEFQWTRLGVRSYRDDISERKDPRGRSYFWIGGAVEEIQEKPGTDTHAINRLGAISATCFSSDWSASAIKSLGDVRGFDTLEQP